MNSGEIGFILFIVLFIGFGILKVIRSGEGGEFLSFMKMMKKGQADAFEGESKTLAVQIDGKAGMIEARTLMDILNQLSGIRERGILYLEDSGKMGRNLEFRYSSVGGDDYIEIREFAGEELIREQSINIEKNPMEAMDFISDALKSATPDTDEWWSKGEEDRSENQGNLFSSATEPVDNADEFSHESSVIVYNKSPLAASLPWLGILAFSTLLIQAQAPASGPDFFVANCFNLFFAIVLLLILISNENLGDRISVDTDKSRIWVGHRGFRTDFKQKLCIEYGNSDYIKIFTRKETVEQDDGDHATATTYEIRRYQIGGSHDTIFGFNGFSNTLSKMKAVRIGKSIARVAGLDYRKK